MKRKLFSVLLAVAFILQGAVMTAVADTTHPTQVSVPINVEVSKAAQNSWSNKESVEGTGEFTFDFRAVMDTSNIKDAIDKWYAWSLEHLKTYSYGDDVIYNDLVENHLKTTVVKGDFDVIVTYPSSLNVDGAYITGGSMYGFNDEAKTIFHEESRSVTTSGSDSILTIKIATNAPGDPSKDLTVKDLYENANTYLPTLTFTVKGVSLSGVGTYTVTGAFKGKTTFAIDGVGTDYKVDYNGIEDADHKLSAVVKISDSGSQSQTQGSYSNTGLTPGGTTSPTTTGAGGFKVWFNGNQVTVGSGNVSTGNYTVWDLIKTYPGTRWGIEDDLGVIQQLSPDTEITVDAKGNLVDKATGKLIRGATRENDTYEAEDHFAYVSGYPDGTVKPESNITREEVATILYRLLKGDARLAMETTEKSFSDVDENRWSNLYISSVANGGYVEGYPDGTFAPAKNITRAEFATLIVRYANGTVLANGGALSDISGHWAEKYILTAIGEGWITGYEDGTFRPDRYITRAEAMTIINRVLARKVDATGIHADAKIWSDNNASSWYYYEVQEATNAHNYTRQEDGLTETWVSIK